ncbi:SDR family NAD(P)-dependent oxidoreductase [Embleya scabrispora]|uniref:SDR family NAD(P)-dependent oxidoreductase n=1 Tax=Embleya scabrispora TaxID=159449 RepID=UPI00036B291C|nr:SDR family NAD(P)-dependent oxidoreductase [Embleya scabrispora]MYS81668.1 SDR family NAD(P)-dependent oxidoreductase [Streptomyces sp. SID5474]
MLQEFDGRVAVVTGAASGIGLAMAERFSAEGMKVVLGDIEQGALDKAVARITDAGGDAIGHIVDVSVRESVFKLADAAFEHFGAVHVLCNNAGIGSGSEGKMWEHDPKDWDWCFAVNVFGVFNGIQAFVPRMLAQNTPGHIVNTSSGDGGIAPLPNASVYATTKAAVVTMTEALYAQLGQVHAQLGASVLFPGPKMLRTGLWESYRNRPERFAKSVPRKTPYNTLDAWEKAMRDAGQEIEFTPVESVAADVLDGIRENRFWILPASEHSDGQITARSQSMLARSNPSYLETFVLDK